MTTDELIRALRTWATALKAGGELDSLVTDLFAAADRLEEMEERIAIMAADALELLEAKVPRVMTLDEVKQHNNQDGCVWFEQPTYNADAAFVIQDEECTEIISPYILGEPINHGYWSNSNYNVTWRAWTARPTDEQQKAVKWNDI